MNITIPSQVSYHEHIHTCGQVSYLSDGMEAQRGEFPFSPVVRVDFPAFDDGVGGHQAPELGDTAVAPFLKPISLIMPHCFDPGATSHDTAQHDRCMTHQAQQRRGRHEARVVLAAYTTSHATLHAHPHHAPFMPHYLNTQLRARSRVCY